MLFIFIIAIAVLSVSIGFLINWMWSAMFTASDEPEPPVDNPCDLDDPEKRREFERRDLDAPMAIEEHIALLRKGAAAWNKWRDENPDIRPDLRSPTLRAPFPMRLRLR
jgi:hypothetical protein